MGESTLVIGGTGNIGRHVVDGLREQGLEARPMSRRSGGDVSDPPALAAALDGVDSVFLIWPFMTGELAAQVASQFAGRRVVYVSAMSAESGFWGEVEAAIREVTDRWTFLRPSGFATNTLGWQIRSRTPPRYDSRRRARGAR